MLFIILSLFMILCTESYFKIDLYRCHILPNVIELLEIYCALDSLERAHSSFSIGLHQSAALCNISVNRAMHGKSTSKAKK